MTAKNKTKLLFVSFVVLSASFLFFLQDVSADICDEDQTLFKLYPGNNSHVYAWDDIDTPNTVSVCYYNVTGRTYGKPYPHACVWGNTLFYQSTEGNAHVRDGWSSIYDVPVCYGDLTCRITENACDANEDFLMYASNTTNAHVSLTDVLDYNVCCRQLTCGNDQIDPGETCDDGNRWDGDGCSHTCQLEFGCAESTPDLWNYQRSGSCLSSFARVSTSPNTYQLYHGDCSTDDYVGMYTYRPIMGDARLTLGFVSTYIDDQGDSQRPNNVISVALLTQDDSGDYVLSRTSLQMYQTERGPGLFLVNTQIRDYYTYNTIRRNITRWSELPNYVDEQAVLLPTTDVQSLSLDIEDHEITAIVEFNPSSGFVPIELAVPSYVAQVNWYGIEGSKDITEEEQFDSQRYTRSASGNSVTFTYDLSSTQYMCPRCGDGTTQSFGRDGILGNDDDEECDDGNTNNEDSCIIDESAGRFCKWARCGDGYLFGSANGGTEQCDANGRNGVPGSGCTTSCNLTYANEDTFVRDIQCAVNTPSNWTACANADYFSSIRGVRSHCFAWDAQSPVQSGTVQIQHETMGVVLSRPLVYNASSGWLELLWNASTTSLNILRSGTWDLTVTCGESTVAICPVRLPRNILDWVVPFGSYFNMTSNYSVQQACCFDGLRSVQNNVVTIPRFDRYLVENFYNSAPGQIDSMLACNWQPAATACQDGMTKVLGRIGGMATGPEQSANEYLCCAPELSISVVSGSCLENYEPVAYLENPSGGRVSFTPGASYPVVVCAAPKDASEVLSCTPRTGSCNAGTYCMYSRSSTGNQVGDCDDYTSLLCCNRQAANIIDTIIAPEASGAVIVDGPG